MSTLRKGFSHEDRYEIDGALQVSAGWCQIDTWQDANYFGIWTNPISLKIFTHCEGDRSLEECSDDDDYKTALTRCLEFYDRPAHPTKIDCVFAARSHPKMYERLVALGFEERLH